MVNIKGIAKEKVLLALWNTSRVQGISFLGLQHVDEEVCKIDIEESVKNGWGMYFDYYKGKVIKCDISGDEFNPRLYDRDLGEGAAQAAINSIK